MSPRQHDKTSALAVSATVVLLGFALLTWPNAPLPADAKADHVIVHKQARRLQLTRDGVALKSYRIALGKAPIGHKQQEGDGKTPEGDYVIDWRNPDSCCHLSLHLSYPNTDDVERAQVAGVPPGENIMIHGFPNGASWFSRLHRWGDWTNGCIAVTDLEMDELWRAVDDGTPITIDP